MVIDEKNLVIVGMADLKVEKAPKVFRTNLGSCIAICLFHREKQVGGLLHYMLPSSEIAVKLSVGFKKAKYADTGLEELLHLLEMHYSVHAGELEAKIFGGAKVLQLYTLDIGKSNSDMAQKLLSEKRIKITACKTGGVKGYKIDFDLNTGKVMCQIFGASEEVF